MNRVFLYPQEISNLDNDNTIIIADPMRASHVQDILQAKVGDTIKIVAINRGLGLAKILGLNEKKLKLELSPITSQSPNTFHDEIWVGACHPQTVKKIFEYATSMGVTRIRFFKAELSEKSYLTSKIFEAQNQDLHLALGLAQSGINFQMPEVVVSPYFPTSIPNSPTFLFSLTERQNLFAKTLPSLNQNTTLVFGPERGFTANEERSCLNMGMTPVNIHPSTLRIEVALIRALSQLHARRFFLA